MENETKETKTTKQNWVKSHSKLCIIAIIIVVAAVAIYFVLGGQGGSPEQVAQTYVEAVKEGNSDKIMAITDLKGAYAWEKCDKDPERFLDEYKKVSDSDVNSYKDELKKSLDTAMAMIKAFGGVEITLQDIEEPEKLANGLYKVTANMEMKVFGMTQSQGATLVVYNGKYIGEMSE